MAAKTKKKPNSRNKTSPSKTNATKSSQQPNGNRPPSTQSTTVSNSSSTTTFSMNNAVLAALVAIIVPAFLLHNHTLTGPIDPNPPALSPSSPPHASPSLTTTTTRSLEAEEDEDNFVVKEEKTNDYLSGISSFDNHVDPHLTRMNFTLPGETEEETFMAYVTPHVSTFYRDEDGRVDGNRTLKRMQWNGLAGKFVNLSPENMVLNWDDGRGGEGVYIATAPAFEAVSTATFPGHQFYFAPQNDHNNIKWRCRVTQNKNVYFYDPFDTDDDNIMSDAPPPKSLNTLGRKKLKRYKVQKRNLAFSKEYQKVTGREYLSLYPNRPPPMHKMWNADYFGQQHWVATSETRYTSLPPEDELQPIPQADLRRRRDPSSPLPHAEYREPSPLLNLTVTVLSCAPRVFEIRNFLSPVEVDHIVHMATGMKLHVSSTSGGGAGVGAKRSTDSSTRSSRNSWVKRGKSAIIDGIYRRAADLMRIDEALLRDRAEGERDDEGVFGRTTAAEDLQLVHYGVGQQYTPHHDFSHPNAGVPGQPARFATLLLYLNEDLEGGSTEFQRWMNSKSGKPLAVKPEVGKAVLFYSLLPDGNMDDLSQHAATPVINGEKWLINLWTWDPRFAR